MSKQLPLSGATYRKLKGNREENLMKCTYPIGAYGKKAEK